MFSLASGAYQAYMAQQQVNILIVGASSVGKTTLLERLKVTQFRGTSTTTTSTSSTSRREILPLLQTKERIVPPLPGRIVNRRRPVETTTTTSTTTRFWVCPSPQKYQNTIVDSDSDDDTSLDEQRPLQTPKELHRNTSLETVEIRNNTAPSTSTTTTTTTQQYDLKPNTQMLPLIKIRPTIGMNLAKFKAAGVHCHVWDVGGQLVDLWERYYDDCDAVIFVYKWDDNDDDNDTDNDTDEQLRVTRQQQRQQDDLLQTVRANIPDDVPFLLLLHSWHSCPEYSNNVYRTEPMLPDRPLQALCVGNAATGQGIRSAMEWLLPLAKQRNKQSIVK